MEPDLDRYLAALPGLCRSEKTVIAYRSQVCQLAAWLRERDLSLTERAVMEYVRFRQKDDRKRPRTIRSLRPALAHFLKFTGQDLNLKSIPWPPLDKPQRYVPTDADLDALDLAADRMPSASPGKRYRRARARAILAIFRYAGLRRRELLDLRVGDIDQSEEVWKVYVAYGKGGVTDWVPLQDTARAIVAEYLIARAEWCRGRILTPEIRQALWPVDRHRRLDDKGLTTLFRDLLDSARLDRPITPHCLRHWFATSLCKVTDVANVSRLLRHQSIDITLDYLHWDNAEINNAVQALGKREKVLPDESEREKELKSRVSHRDRRPSGMRPLRRRPA